MLDALSAPISADEFDRLMAGFAPLSDKIAVAVSGGPDSMALALSVQRWARRPCVAFIVEHGLRAESAQEAQQVKQRLEQIGMTVEILPWQHGTIKGRIHEQARAARYALLFDACRRHGARDLLLAHHSGDQAETVLMRVAKGSGIDGLAGIAAQTVRDDIRLLRPFLPVSKQRLVETCHAAGMVVVTDPSNASEKYARGRLRQIMPLLQAEGLSDESLNALAARAREAKEALDYYTRELLARAGRVEAGGCVRLARSALCGVPRAVALRAVTACLRFVHDDDYPPEYSGLSSLLEALMSGKEEPSRTLYGCLVSMAGEQATFLREPSMAQEVQPLAAGGSVLWDKRWRVRSAAVEDVTVRALGNPPHEEIDRLAPSLRHAVPQGRVRASLPALWRGNTLVAIPSFDGTGSFSLAYACSSLF